MKKHKLYECAPIHDLREMMDKTCKRHGARTLFLAKEGDGLVAHTYSDFNYDVSTLRVALARRGLLGKRIIVMGENCYAWCVAYMAAVSGLGVAVPVDKDIPVEELKNIAKISGAGAIVYSERYADKAAVAGKRIQKISFGEALELCGGKFAMEEYAALAERSVDSDDMAVLLFTSGTTGVSKGVMLSHRNICCNLENLPELVKIDESDVALSVLPLHHVYECTAGFLYPMSRGACIAFSEGVRYVMKNMREMRPTKMICVPLLLETMYNKIWHNIRKKGIESKVRGIIKATELVRPESARMALKRKIFAEIHGSFGGRLDLLVSGGAPIDPKVISGLREFGFNVIQGYGLTECAPLAAVNPQSAPKDHSAGVVLPGGELKIVGADDNGVGEICYRGDNVMMGYYKMPEETAAVKKNGWLHTGDLGYIDGDGYLVITGRKKNVIVTANGKNIFPEELETYLGRSPYVSECAVLGIMNDKKGDYDVVAVIYPDFAHARDVLAEYASDAMVYEKLGEEVEKVNAAVQAYKRIGTVIMCKEELPKNSSRKIKRVGLADLVMDEYLAKRG